MENRTNIIERHTVDKPSKENPDAKGFDLMNALLKCKQKPIRLNYKNEPLFLQLDLFPKHYADNADVIISGRIVRITKNGARICVLPGSTLSDELYRSHGRRGPKRKELKLVRTPGQGKMYQGLLLQYAMDTDNEISLRVRVARESLTGKMDYLELCEIVNASELAGGIRSAFA